MVPALCLARSTCYGGAFTPTRQGLPARPDAAGRQRTAKQGARQCRISWEFLAQANVRWDCV